MKKAKLIFIGITSLLFFNSCDKLLLQNGENIDYFIVKKSILMNDKYAYKIDSPNKNVNYIHTYMISLDTPKYNIGDTLYINLTSK